jgi:putative oxidoreductase
MKKHIPLILRIIVAVILIQTLRFKFTAHPDSVYIFENVGLEPYGRIGIGFLELIASILLLVPKNCLDWSYPNFRDNWRSYNDALNKTWN